MRPLYIANSLKKNSSRKFDSLFLGKSTAFESSLPDQVQLLAKNSLPYQVPKINLQIEEYIPSKIATDRTKLFSS